MLFLIEFLFEQRFHDGDGIFNYSRLLEASIDIHGGQLPQFNFNTGQILGGATNTFYPWLTFLPVIILKPLMSAFTFWYFLNSVIVLVGEEASYFAVRKFGKSRLYSFSFTIVYLFASFLLTQYYALNDIGATFDALLTPLIIYYWYCWLTKNKWVGLTVCLLITVYANIVTPLIIVICLIAMTIAWYKKLTWHDVINGLKACGIFILCTAPIWIPICVLYFHNNMSLPVFADNNSLQIPVFDFPFYVLFVPEQLSIWTYTDIFSFLLSFICWKKLPSWCKKFIIISMFIMFICFRPIAIFLISHTPFAIFQFMHRFTFFSHLLLSAVFVEIFFKIILRRWNSFLILLIALITGICTIGLLPSGEYSTYRTKNEVIFSKQFKRYPNYAIYRNHMIHRDSHKSFEPVSFTNTSGSTFNHYVPAMFDEYYPQSCVDSKRVVRDHHPLIEPRTNGSNYIHNGMRFYKQHSGKYTVPIATFHTQKYLIDINSHKNVINGQDKLLSIHLRHGMNKITVQPLIMPYRIFSFVLALIGLIILASKYYCHLHYYKYMLHYKCK